ncbi:amino acid adenylation domain-containing protein [Ancylothrix sp. C2]|uniref:non-ribosomal peptide synthetase n=1 Tax=Ancylothrix sp. D3o TaxID=2953691 RepID=UPI0021BAE9E8|nr:non-ribosomal peptide synthetase [Ancylothrix sp. D3o]MCT7951959.1 amino acid adenylation domain-containing protein [Ancylothrix sp. D3o]
MVVEKNTNSLPDQETEVFIFPASFAQNRLWFLNQLAPANPFYNVTAGLQITGPLNITALQQTLNEIIRRHETLRTTFVMQNGQLLQLIHPNLTLPLPIINLQNIPATEQQKQTQKIATEEAKKPFDLATGPLFKTTLLQLSEAQFILLLNLHHIVADGWSIGVLIQEFATLYTNFQKNQPLTLPQLPLQYADFSEWQRQYLQGEILETQLNYWQQKLKEITPLNLPTDRPRPPLPTYKGAKQHLTLSPPLTQALKTLSRQQNVTLFVTLLAAFKTLLYRYTQQEDITIGSPIANRNQSEIEPLIGFFVNSLVLRTNLTGNPTFQELLNRVKQTTIEAYTHQDLPFEKLVEKLQPERDPSRNPLFQISFSLQNTPIQTLQLPELTLQPLEIETGTAKLDLEFHIWEELEIIKCQIIYSTDLFNQNTIARMAEHFQTLLQAIAAHPNQPLSHLQILAPDEQHQILIKFNQNQFQPTTPNNQKLFHQHFETQVEKAPEAVAIVWENQQITYRQLNNKANQIAHHLQKLGVLPDVLVGICLERSPELIAALLGILKAGGGYLPLDPNYPEDRLKFILEDTQISLLITHSSLAPTFNHIEENKKTKLSIICIDKPLEKTTQKNPTTNLTPDNLAYVIYTSGSTGTPKGVLIEHRGLNNLIQAQKQIFNPQPHHRILQFASLSFDASIFEIVMALANGATLYLGKKESLLPGQPLISFLKRHSITHITLPPAVLKLLPNDELPALQTIICAGETCTPDIVKKWATNRTFINAYGPTETTVWASFAEIIDTSKNPPIGRPIPNTKLYILDKNLQPVPVGIPGELYISGAGVARGYLNRPALTAEKFISLSPPFPIPNSPSPIYKTGDLARYLPDGNIEFLGRIDQQVKIRGHRIELEEIETLLTQHPNIKQTAVIVLENPDSNKRLIAYTTHHQFPAPSPQELRNFLKEKLPQFMLPNTFICIDSFPLNSNGKIDRHRLTSPEFFNNTSDNKTFIAPRTPAEINLAKIWAEILNTQQISITDNFFEAGGDSLTAVKLLDQIRTTFNRDFPLSFLFLNPTLEALAKTLTLEKPNLSWSPLVPLQTQGKKPPFFCVHPIFGVVFPYYELAFHLGKNQPFYALQPKGIDGRHPPLTTIEEMAAFYIQAMQTVQPKGPYYIGGWSFGGLVAFEMAQQLQKAGEKIALLALLDTQAPVSTNKPSLWQSCKFLFTTVSRYIWPFFLDYFSLTTLSDNPKNKKSALKFSQILNLISNDSKQQIFRELALRPIFPVFWANNQATLNYTPEIYPNRITLFKSNQESLNNTDSTLGWSHLTTERVDILEIPGNHLTMVRKPHVKILAEQLKKCM